MRLRKPWARGSHGSFTTSAWRTRQRKDIFEKPTKPAGSTSLKDVATYAFSSTLPSRQPPECPTRSHRPCPLQPHRSQRPKVLLPPCDPYQHLNADTDYHGIPL